MVVPAALQSTGCFYAEREAWIIESFGAAIYKKKTGVTKTTYRLNSGDLLNFKVSLV